VTADIPHTYVAYGTVVESTISLPELLSEASDKDRETTAGVSVIEESLPRHPDGLNSEATEVYTDSSEGLRIFRLDDGFFLVYRGIGTLRIQPDRISVSQEATASRADIRWLVVSLGLRLALVQRGVSFSRECSCHRRFARGLHWSLRAWEVDARRSVLCERPRTPL